jgi:hypothetical protein
MWHFTTWLDLLDHWQTGLAGFLAFAAGFGTVVATMIIARRQIAASREEADRVIATTRAQTETTVRLAQKRDEDEYDAFRTMLEAAMTRVLFESAWAKKTYPQLLTQTTGSTVNASTVEALTVRQCLTKGAFAELRGACVRQRSPLTGEFLYLEGEIDNFASQWTMVMTPLMQQPIKTGKHAGLGEQLDVIEAKAFALREKVAQDRWGLVLPGRAERADI